MGFRSELQLEKDWSFRKYGGYGISSISAYFDKTYDVVVSSIRESAFGASIYDLVSWSKLGPIHIFFSLRFIRHVIAYFTMIGVFVFPILTFFHLYVLGFLDLLMIICLDKLIVVIECLDVKIMII